ncbi:Zn-dependent hydrolase [Acidaminobacter sp. JC074]|uniref:Zn-dependent hydrolase n=1 Tax=Acidaminobacter sp. JC074 TaxID=2530199 RepID=UPI001F0E99CC|nr:Zn-dependent hydrolase [Acidaminobacter sp. JC074]MCH4890176.1 Zn-dependent hydrolase [Acidaminobacter sp. JC074]
MKIKIDRVKKLLDELSLIGKTEDDGVTRVAFSKEDLKARNMLISRFKALDMIVRQDPAGNIIASTSPGKGLVIGSHLDTVVNGGNLDGILGVVAGLEVYETLREHDIDFNMPFHIVIFAAEEGVRLNGTFGSRAIAGLISDQEIYDLSGQNYGIVDFENIHLCQRFKDEMKYLLEMHIEQGRLLEKNKNKIGIVKDIFGIKRKTIHIYGQADHAGNTPMNIRNDAMVSAARVICDLTNQAEILDDTVATFGYVNVKPNCVNVIPSEVELKLEVRSNNPENFDKIDQALMNILDNYKIQCLIKEDVYKKPKLLSKELQDVIEEVVIKSVPFQYISSGAGHDSASFAEKIPTAMIFVPSIDGVSHSPKEDTSMEDIEIGCQVLLDTVYRLIT